MWPVNKGTLHAMRGRYAICDMPQRIYTERVAHGGVGQGTGSRNREQGGFPQQRPSPRFPFRPPPSFPTYPHQSARAPSQQPAPHPGIPIPRRFKTCTAHMGHLAMPLGVGTRPTCHVRTALTWGTKRDPFNNLTWDGHASNRASSSAQPRATATASPIAVRPHRCHFGAAQAGRPRGPAMTERGPTRGMATAATPRESKRTNSGLGPGAALFAGRDLTRTGDRTSDQSGSASCRETLQSLLCVRMEAQSVSPWTLVHS